MPTRRPSLRNAAVEFGLLASAMLAGAFGASLMAAAGIALLMQLHWAATRRAALTRMALGRRVTNTLLALALIFGATAAAYLLGLSLRGLVP